MPPRLITHQPRPSLAGVLGGAGARARELRRFERLTATGRDALYQGFRILAAGPWRTAYLPSYHCGAEVEAARAAGFEVVFYPVDRALDPDPPALASVLRTRPGPVVVTHFFGHPSRRLPEVAAVCARIGIPLVEDACHGPMARTVDGTGDGQIVANSFRKVLGTLDGGGLRVSRDRLGALLAGGSAPSTPEGRRAIRPLFEPLVRLLGGRDDWADRGRSADVPNPDRAYGRRISWPSERSLRQWDPDTVDTRRRAHWTRLTGRLAGVHGFAPVFPSLGSEAVPLSLALRVRDRPSLVAALLAEGVDSYTFGARPHPSLPEPEARRTAPLRDEILGLPVHHRLTGADVERIAEVLGKLLPLHAPPKPGPCAESQAT